MSPMQRRAMFDAWALLPMAWLALHTAGFKRVHRAVFDSAPLRGTAEPDIVAACVAGVETASRFCLLRSTCLTRSLALAWLLRRRGIASVLRIGVRLEASQLD